MSWICYLVFVNHFILEENLILLVPTTEVLEEFLQEEKDGEPLTQPEVRQFILCNTIRGIT